MDNNTEEMITCSRCGSLMKASARYCMKCGNLNPNHPDNKNLLKFIPKNIHYFVGSGKSIVGHIDFNGKIIKEFADNTGSNNLCFFITYFAYLLTLVVCFIFIKNIDDNFYYVTFSYYLFSVSLSYLYIYSFEKMFMKMNERWWSSLIPIYNYFILSKEIFKSSLYGLLLFVPIVNVIYNIILFYKLGKKFNKSGILTILFPFIMIPVIGLGESVFENRRLFNNGINGIEKSYRLKMIFFTTDMFFIIISFIVMIANNLDKFKFDLSYFENRHYYVIARKMKNSVVPNSADIAKEVTCNGETYYGDDGVYYFYYSNVGRSFKYVFSNLYEPVSGYVKMVVSDGNRTYYLSISDGTKGIREINVNDLSVDKVIDFTSLDSAYEEGINCQIN